MKLGFQAALIIPLMVLHLIQSDYNRVTPYVLFVMYNISFSLTSHSEFKDIRNYSFVISMLYFAAQININFASDLS